MPCVSGDVCRPAIESSAAAFGNRRGFAVGAGHASAAIEVHEEGADPAELADLTASLREELWDLEIDRVSAPSAGEAPAGTRGLEFAAIGALIVEFASSAEILTKVVDAIRSWAGGRENRTIKIGIDGDTLEIAGASSEEQERLISAWIERHSDA
jgi:hypothetical protein